MAHRVVVLAPFEVRPARFACIVYRAGWSGLMPEAHFALTPKDKIRELPRHGEQSQPAADAAHSLGDP